METLQHSSSSSDDDEEEQADHMTESADHMSSSWQEAEAEETDTSDEEVKVVTQRNHFQHFDILTFFAGYIGNSQYDWQHPSGVV